MNTVSLLGRLTSEPEVKELADGSYRTMITLAVSRDYKNSDGNVSADFIRCTLWNGIASATKEYCHKGDLVAIRGKLQSNTYEINNEKKYVLDVIVEKIQFVNSKKTGA